MGGSKDKIQSPKAGANYLNYGEEDEMEIQGYKRSNFKTLITGTFIFASLGTLRLIFHWWPHLMLYSTYTHCPLYQAEKVLVTERYGRHNYRRYHVKLVMTLTPRGISGSITPSTSRLGKHGKEEMASNRNTTKLVFPTADGTFREADEFRHFFCKKLRYVWCKNDGVFEKLQGIDKANTNFLHKCKGLSETEQANRRMIYGPNEMKVEVASIPKLLVLEVLNPFYVFQVFSVCLWFSDHYYYYAAAIIIMSVVGVSSSIYQTRKNQNRLRSTVESSDIVTVWRGKDVFESIPTEHLVPGDVLVIPAHGCTMNCDAVLLSGNCIVNESMLTGESVPVTKTPLPNTSEMKYSSKEHARHTLFSGTQILQTRYYGQEKVLVVVIRSGFLTAKGSLVRSIMYPPPVDYKFEQDSYKFVGFLAFIAFIGFLASIFWKIEFGEPLRDIIIQSIDLVTIVIPPALPAAMTVGRIYALKRLERKGIYCTSPRTITVTGSIDCVCFDKTGTLTEEGLDLWGVVCASKAPSPGFQFPVRDSDKLVDNGMKVGMATCHSLTLIDEKLIGDPLDLKMFEWTTWTLEEPEVADSEKFDSIIPAIVRSPEAGEKAKSEVGILRQFPFSSSLQRMSVITKTMGESDFDLYCKGSPEIISYLSLPDSIPKDFTSVLTSYTQQGFRVIAMGHKRLSLTYTKAQRVLREDLEKDLTFLGLIVLDNRLKPETTLEIAGLKNAEIRTIMVTGDNIQTSMSVAIDCGMVDPTETVFIVEALDQDESIEAKPSLTFSRLNQKSSNAIESFEADSKQLVEHRIVSIELPDSHRYHLGVTGKAFSAIKAYYPELMDKMLMRGTVFARMSPDQKQQLVEHLQALGYFVGMCGDGANDCGALKAAHAGISLSDAEASVASPFTCKENNIACVSLVIKEGRTALVTSFGIFKYMAIYSFTQFISVLILYTVSANVSDGEFLYIDLFIISLFALFFGYTEPYQGRLVKQPPPSSLVSLAPIVSISLHMISVMGFQALAFFYVQQQSWFVPYESKEDPNDVKGYENYTVFTVSIFQYISMAVVFSQGKPYRKSIVTNYRLIGAVIIMTTFTVYLVLRPFKLLHETFQLMIPPSFEFQLALLGIAAVNLVVSILIEEGIVNFLLGKKKLSCRKPGLAEHERIDQEVYMDSDWPPITGLEVENPT